MSLSPHASNDEFTASVLRNVFEPLVELDEDMAPRGILAESWHSPDDLTWTFRLRPAIRRHDGGRLTASDVAASLERSIRDPTSRRTSSLNAVEAIEALDDRTLVLRTRSSFATLPNRLAAILIAFEAPGRSPAGTGPYRVRRFQPGGDTVLEAVEGHRDGDPPIRRVEFRVIPSAMDRVSALRRGDIDLLVDAPAEEYVPLSADPRLRTLSRPGLRTIFLGLNGAGRPVAFRDVRVRRAVALAIDKAALVNGPLGGHGDVTDQLVPSEILGYHKALPRVGRDPAEARRLLRESGRGNGFDVALDFVPARYRAVEAVVAAVVRDLEAVRIRVRPRPQPLKEFLARLDARRDVSLFLLGWLNATGDATVTYEYLLHTPGRGFGLYNVGGYSSRAVDGLLERAVRAEAAERQSILEAVAENVAADVPLIPLYRQRDLYAFSANLGFEPRLDRRIRAEKIRWSR